MSVKTILVVAAHPDDEVLGCGGAMAHHARMGDRVHVLILGEGITSRLKTSRENAKHALTALVASSRKANSILGVRSIQFAGFPDNRFDSMDRLDIIKRVEACRTDVNPDTVYTHHVGDVNVDHQRTHEAVVTACRPLPKQSVKTLLFFEVASSTECQTPGTRPPFQPNWYIPIEKNDLRLKLRALDAYRTEMRSWPHPRSLRAVEHLARWRGTSVGVHAAEAFILGRKIDSCR